MHSARNGFDRAVDQFRAAGGRGINVTRFKLDAFLYATDHKQRAQLAGASSCLKFEGDRIYAENFDAVGLVNDVNAISVSLYAGVAS